MLVGHVMTSPVISITASASIADAAKLMLANRISGLPVVDNDGKLVGMVSEGDFLHRGELGTGSARRPWWLAIFAGPGKAADDYVRSHGCKVSEVMVTDVITTHRAASLDEVVDAMSRHRIKRLPVMEDDKLVGIIARSDLLRALAQALPAARPEVIDDERIRKAVQAELTKQGWALIHPHVTDGIVELSGTVFDDRERLAARVAAENVPGVQSVTDNLVWIEPISGTVILPAERGSP